MSEEADRCELAEYLRGLEEERRKVEAFKRELPLCMQLLTDAIQSTQAQLRDDDTPMDSDDISERHHPRDRSHPSHRPIPGSTTSGASAAPPEGSKRDAAGPAPFLPPFPGGPAWLSEAISAHAAQQGSRVEQRMEVGVGMAAVGERGPGRPLRDAPEGGAAAAAPPPLFRTPGAFLPFSREQHSPHVPRPASPPTIAYPLAVHFAHTGMAGAPPALEPDASPASVLDDHRSQGGAAGAADGEGGHSSDGTAMATDTPTSSGALSRKQRRCWSPELHRRFVNALNQLGGSQVATPKQIRELMKVDGLTNDEVKSHLQKYRLHTRRPGPLPPSAASPAPGQVVVLGTFFSSVGHDYSTATAPSLPPPATSGDEARLPGAFPPGSLFQVASGLLGSRHTTASSIPTDLSLADGRDSDGALEKQASNEGQPQALTVSALGTLRAVDSVSGQRMGQGGHGEDARQALQREPHSPASPIETEESMEEKVTAQQRRQKLREQERPQEMIVQNLGQHAFRTFLPPRPEASGRG